MSTLPSHAGLTFAPTTSTLSRVTFTAAAHESDSTVCPSPHSFAIREGKLIVENGLPGKPNHKVITVSETWLGILAGERNLVRALLTRRFRR
jgi:hypothetical protein